MAAVGATVAELETKPHLNYAAVISFLKLVMVASFGMARASAASVGIPVGS